MTVSQAHDDWYLATLEHALQSELYGGLRDLLIDLFTWHLRPSLERALAEARTAFVQSLAVSFMPDLRTEDRLRAVLDTPPFLQAVAGLIELSHDRIAIDDCRPTFAALDLPGANDVDLDAAWQALGRRFLQALQLSPTLRDLLPLSDADIFSPARESTLDALLGTVLPDPTSSRLRIDEDALLRYRTALQQRYSALPTSALFVSSPDGDGAPIALADVFTEIALVRDHERRKRRRAPEPGETTGGGAGGESGRVVDLFDLERPFAEARTLAEVLSSEDRVIVLLGAPGAGKSTLLQALVLSLCRPPDDVAPALELGVNADTVPIPVPLAAYAAARAADPSMRLRRFMVERHQAHLPQIQTLLASERALVLLDGYEAHRDPALDNSLGDEIWGLVTHHPRARFVLTARPGAYQEAPMPAMVSTWRLAPFDRARIGHFLRSWFRALARTGADLDLTAFPNAKADRLRDQVMSRPWLAQLAQNPLMATLLVLVARTQRRRLPEKRAAYHDEAVRALVHAWERAHEIRIAAYARATARGIASDAAHADGRAPATQDLPPAALLVRLMAHVAWRAAVDAGGQRAIPAAQLRTWLRERLDQEPTWQGDRGARGVDVLIDLAHRAPGLLRPDTAAADDAGAPSARATTYRFLHPILQDHLVAQHLLDVHDEAATQRWVRRHVHDSRWNPVLQLAIGGARQAQADGLLRAVLSAPTSVLEPRLHRDLRFVCRCLGEGADAGPELRAEVAQHLFTALIDDALLDWKGLARDAAGVGAVPEVMAVMVSKLTDPRLDVRLSAVAYFARIGTDDEAVRSTFEDLLADDDLGMRQAAVAYFARLGSVDEVTRRAFADRLCDGDPRIRQVAMAYFTHLGAEDDATRRVVRERLEDEDIHVRRAAASWMLRFGAAADDDLRAMASALDDDDATVRQRALAFLARRGGADRRTRARFAERLSARDVAEREMAVAYFVRQGMGDELRQAFVERLEDPDELRGRLASVAWFAHVGAQDPEVRRMFLVYAGHRDVHLRHAALSFLARIGAEDDATLAVLAECVADEDPGVRRTAVAYASRIARDDADTQEAFADRLDDVDVSVRRSAVLYFLRIGSFDETVRRQIHRRLDDDNLAIRRASIEYLTRVADLDDVTRDAVRARLEDPAMTVREAALAYFADLGVDEPAVRAQVAARLEDDDPFVRRAAIEYFVRLGAADVESREAFEARLTRLDDPPALAAALRYFALIGFTPAQFEPALDAFAIAGERHTSTYLDRTFSVAMGQLAADDPARLALLFERVPQLVHFDLGAALRAAARLHDRARRDDSTT